MTENKTIKARPLGRKPKIQWTKELVHRDILMPLYKGVSMASICKELNLTRPAVTQAMKKHYGLANKQEAIQFVIKEQLESRID